MVDETQQRNKKKHKKIVIIFFRKVDMERVFEERGKGHVISS